ncbi:MAG TPA: hypothetical protein PKE32_07855, partial [Miltoncostaeaceae bacterium]|nr:hypothetical protein [Miltoncostaeaceae bacterium]
MRRLPLIVICAAVLIVGIGGVLWWKAGQTTPVSERAALAGYREDAVSGGDRRGPAPGVYTYDQVGREKNRFGPLAINRDLPAEARYTITATPDGYREELALAEQHIEGKRFRLRADGARQATWRRNNITFLGVGRDDRKEINPPALSLPASLPVGRTWSAEYDAGSIHGAGAASSGRSGRWSPPRDRGGAHGGAEHRGARRQEGRHDLVVPRAASATALDHRAAPRRARQPHDHHRPA